ncbi:MAG: FKBP-type peptidyl-prolyl cis-trans isomerase [Verrucomicrobiota bacterium]
MAEAKSGDKVKVHYTGKFEDGTVFDTSNERGPLEITLGNHDVIPGVENAVEGMQEGEKKQVTVPCEEGYGQHDEQQVLEVPKDKLPDDVEPQEGMVLEGQTQDGNTVRLQVVEVGEDAVKVDANHPLAGKTLVFDLELAEVTKQ